MSNEYGNDNMNNNMFYRDSNSLSPQSPEVNNPAPHGSSPQAPYKAESPYKAHPAGGGNKGGDSSNKKKNADSFGVKVGKTAVCALVFGTVAGGMMLGINGIGGKMLPKQDTAIEQTETEDELEQAFKDKNERKAKEDQAKIDAEEEEAKKEAEAAEDAKEAEKADDDTEDSENKDASDTSSDKTINVQETAQSSGAAVTLDYDVADIVEKTQPSIVSITTTGTQTVQSFFQVYSQPTSGAGSGIIVGQNDDSLYVATNYHVIEDADEIKVGFNDGEVVNATVKGYDEDADIALVLVPLSDMKDTTKDAITIASIGDSDAIRVGEPSIAIGNALGYGQSVTVGYISALNRSIEGSEGQYIQTDAAINPGNSGGALINSNGEVIGINSVKYVDSTVEGMGFSIPINEAMAIINDIAAGTQAETASLGIEAADISRQYAQVYGFPMGIYVKTVESGSIAESSDVHVGDIIVEFDGDEVYTSDDLAKKVRKHAAGDSVEMVVYRADDMGFYAKTTITINF